MQNGFTIWFTGLSGSGKTTLANLLKDILTKMGLKTELLDGDLIRSNLNWDLGFTKTDRLTNIKRVAFLAKLLNRNGIIVIASFISPYAEMRSYCRREIDPFVEVYTKCPLEVLIEKDVKGLYKKALAGEITNFTGVSDPYEEPVNPDIIINTDQATIEESASKIVNWLKVKGFILK